MNHAKWEGELGNLYVIANYKIEHDNYPNDHRTYPHVYAIRATDSSGDMVPLSEKEWDDIAVLVADKISEEA